MRLTAEVAFDQTGPCLELLALADPQLQQRNSDCEQNMARTKAEESVRNVCLAYDGFAVLDPECSCKNAQNTVKGLGTLPKRQFKHFLPHLQPGRHADRK